MMVAEGTKEVCCANLLIKSELDISGFKVSAEFAMVCVLFDLQNASSVHEQGCGIAIERAPPVRLYRPSHICCDLKEA